MTNYNERLDGVLEDLGDYHEHLYDNMWLAANGEYTKNEAKQAITSLIKELVAEAKPKDYPVCENNPNQSVSSWCNKCWACRERNNFDLWDGIEVGIEKYEQNLLKALEEV